MESDLGSLRGWVRTWVEGRVWGSWERPCRRNPCNSIEEIKGSKVRVNESSLAQFHIQVSCWFIWLCLIGFWLINWFALIWFLTRYCWSQTLEVSVGCFGACLEFQPKNVYNWACIMLRSLCNLGLQHRPCFCRNEPSCCRKGPANRHEHWVKQAV